jgi:hypothetical protein
VLLRLAYFTVTNAFAAPPEHRDPDRELHDRLGEVQHADHAERDL